MPLCTKHKTSWLGPPPGLGYRCMMVIEPLIEFPTGCHRSGGANLDHYRLTYRFVWCSYFLLSLWLLRLNIRGEQRVFTFNNNRIIKLTQMKACLIGAALLWVGQKTPRQATGYCVSTRLLQVMIICWSEWVPYWARSVELRRAALEPTIKAQRWCFKLRVCGSIEVRFVRWLCFCFIIRTWLWVWAKYMFTQVIEAFLLCAKCSITVDLYYSC